MLPFLIFGNIYISVCSYYLIVSINKETVKGITDSQKEYILGIQRPIPKNERFMILKTYLFCIIPDELFLTPLLLNRFIKKR